MLSAYRELAAEREAMGIPALPLSAEETQALTKPRCKCGQWNIVQRLQFESRERALETGDSYRRSLGCVPLESTLTQSFPTVQNKSQSPTDIMKIV